MKKISKTLSVLSCGLITLFTPSTSVITDLISNNSYRAQEQNESSDKEVLFNLYYFRADGDKSFNTVWFWSEDANSGNNPKGALYKLFGNDTYTFKETDDMEWTMGTIYKDETINVGSAWDSAEFDKTLSVNESSFNGGLIIRNNTGNRKTGDLSIDFSKIDKETKNIYYVDKGDGISGTFYYDINDVPSLNITAVKFDTNGFGLPVLDVKAKKGFKLNLNDIEILRWRNLGTNKSYSATQTLLSGNVRKAEKDHYRIDIINTSTINPTWKYDLIVKNPKGDSTYEIDMQTYYSTTHFDENYTPDFDTKLGSFIQENDETGEKETVFRVWAPFAKDDGVRLVTFEDGTTTTPRDTVKMRNIGKGVYEYIFNENLGGVYYTYSVNNFGKDRTSIPDPYMESGNTNGKRSMVVDWNSSEVLPESVESFKTEFGTWSEVTPSTVSAGKAAVSELHVRDFSSSPSWTGKKENVGKYMALTEKGLTLKDSTIKIGYDYVKELADNGLTHIQLLPIYDFASVDETLLDDKEYQNLPSKGIFNWGYDPQSYNAPEGSYSSEPNDGYVRIRELRSVIQAFSKANLGVIMDVVYNHMPGANGTMFEKIVPGYYFRSQDVSGAGATTHSSRKMFSKFMVDSMRMWEEKYKLSGFRYDLMGIIDATTVMKCAEAVREVNPNAIIYGEGWQMFGSDGSQGPDQMMASQKTLQYFGTPDYSGTGKMETSQMVGAFNDNYRDSLNGGTGNIGNNGFMQNAYYSTDKSTTISTERNKVYYGIYDTHPWGYSQFNSSNAGFDAYSYTNNMVGSSVNYTECHDNLTAYDKLYATTKSEEVAKNLSMLGNVVTASSLGVAFYQFGQEFGRTKEVTDPEYLNDEVVMKSVYESKFGEAIKYFSHNSYNSGDKINAINWDLVKTNSFMIDTFKAALSARKQIAEVPSIGEMKDYYFTGEYSSSGVPANIIANSISVLAKSTDSKAINFLVNPTQREITLNIPYGGSATIIGGAGYNTTVTGTVTVPATSYVIMKG